MPIRNRGSLHDPGTPLIQGDRLPVAVNWGRRKVGEIARILSGLVAAIVDGSPKLSLERTATQFSAQIDAAVPASQIVRLSNTGTGTARFTSSSDQSWLTVSPTDGLLPSDLELRVNHAGLSEGVHTATVTVTASGASNSPQNITVTLSVKAAGTPITPITRQLHLGYRKVRGVAGDVVTTATTGAANFALVLREDFAAGDDWATGVAAAATTLNSLGAGIMIGVSVESIANAKPFWDQVVALYVDAAGGDLAALEQLAITAHAKMYEMGLPNRPIAAVLQASVIDGSSFYVPDGIDWFIVDGRVSPPTGPTQLRALLDTRLAKLTGTTHPCLLLAQANDTGGWTDVNLTALQTVYADVARANGRVNGILWDQYGLPGGTATYPTVRADHEAIFRAVLPGRPANEVPTFPAYGLFESADCTTWTGWAFDPDQLDQPITVRFFDRPRRQSEATQIAEVIANVARGDIVGITKDAGAHGFSLSTPVSLKDNVARAIWAYGVSWGTDTKNRFIPLIGAPKGITCAPPTDPGPPPPSPPPAPGPVPSPRTESVSVSGRGFAFRSARRNMKMASMLAFPSVYVAGSASAGDSRLTYLQAEGINGFRVFGMLFHTATYGPKKCDFYDPANFVTPYLTAIENMVKRARDFDMLVELTIFTDVKENAFSSQTDRVSFARDLTKQLLPYWNVIFEICNENDKNGMADIAQLAEIAQAIKALDPARLVALGDNHGGKDKLLTLNIPPADYLAFHSSRLETPYTWAWVARLAEADHPPLTQTDRPPYDNEPANMGKDPRRTSFQDDAPAHAYAYALVGRYRQFTTLFHCHQGLRAETFTGSTDAALAEYISGLNAASFDRAGTFFTGFGTGGSPILFGSPAALFCCGYHTGVTGAVGQAVVIAPSGWTPAVKSGWSVAIAREVGPDVHGHKVYRLDLTKTGQGGLAAPDMGATIAGWFPGLLGQGNRDKDHEWLRRVAYRLYTEHDKRWGLRHKPIGNNFPRPNDGLPLAVDILMWKDNGELYDVIVGFGDVGSKPGWGFAEYKPTGEWIQPIDEPGGPGGATITLFDGLDYTGASFAIGSDIPNFGDHSGGLPPGDNWHDRVGSLRVPSGHTCTLYEHSNYGGASITFTGDGPNLTHHSGPGPDGTWNNIASSCRIT